MQLTPEESEKLRQLNVHLEEAGKLADQLKAPGRQVMMSVWDSRRAGTLCDVRLQGNVARAFMRRITVGPTPGSINVWPPEALPDAVAECAP